MRRFRAPSEPKAASRQLLESFNWPAKPPEPSPQLLPSAELEDPASPGFASRLVEQRKAASVPPSEQVEPQPQDEPESEDSVMDPSLAGRQAFEIERSIPHRRLLASKSETALPLPAASTRRPRPEPIFTSQPLRPGPQAVQTPITSRMRRASSFAAAPATPLPSSPPPSTFSTLPPRLPPLPHLPALGEDYSGPTSYANWTVANHAEVELAKMAATAASVEDVLRNPDAGRDFVQFCGSLPDTRALPIASLCSDLLAFSTLRDAFRSASNALASTYLQAASPLRLNLPLASRASILEACIKAGQDDTDLGEPIEALKRELEPHLRLWLEDRVVKSMQERLGRWRTGFGWSGMGHRLGGVVTDGLGESFCLTDWTKEDNPIVLVSDGFGAVTGFPCADIVGRNCRFLQGPGTSPDSVEPLRTALQKGEAVTRIVLNYRSDGHPFFNLINITPLKDSDGKIKYFLGGQVDATLTMQEVGVPPSSVALPPTPALIAQMSLSPPFSPYVQAQLQSMQQAAMSRIQPASSAAAAFPPTPPESPSVHGRAYLQPPQGYGALPHGLASPTSASPRPRRFGFFGRKKRRRETTGSTQPDFEHTNTSLEVGGAPAAAEPDVWMRRGSMQSGPEEGGRTWTAGGDAFEQVGEVQPYEPQHTYSRIALVDRPSGKILFANTGFVEFLSPSRSSVVHHHLTSFLTSHVVLDSGSTAEEEKDQTRRLRRNVTLAIEGGHVYRTLVAFEVEKRGKGLAKPKNDEERQFKSAVLHLVPLLNKNEQTEKFVAILG